MKKKRLFALIAMLLAVALLFVGCGNAEQNVTDDPQTEATDKENGGGSGVKGLYGNYFYYAVDNTLYYATGTAGIQAE